MIADMLWHSTESVLGGELKTKVMSYVYTVVAVLAATIVRWSIDPLLGKEAPFSTFIITVIFVAWLQSLPHSILATVLGFVIAFALFARPQPPALEMSLTMISRNGIYFVICGAIATFGEVTRRTRDRLHQAKELSDQRAETLRITFASIGDGIITTDDRGNVTYLNAVAESLTGFDNLSATGRSLESVFRIINETTRQKVENPVKTALQTGTIVGLANHTILIAQDGTERSIDDSAAPIFNRDRKLIGCILVFRDFSQRRQEQLKLEDARSRLESMLVAGEIGTWEFDVVQDIVRADPNLARMIGVPLKDASGTPLEIFKQAIHPDDRDRVWDAIERAIESDSSFESEYRVIGIDQAVRWVIARGRVDRDAAGKAVRLPGIVVDITRQKNAEDRLRASEEHRRQALDSAELGAWHIDPLNMALTTDERFRMIFGVPEQSIDCEGALNLIHRDDRDRIQNALTAALRPKDPQPYAVDYRVIHPNGEIRWVHSKGRMSYEEQGTTPRRLSFNGTVADITERKRMENDLRQLAASLSEADHRKDEFLATLAHELRNPLAPIRNGLELMRLAGSDRRSFEQARTMMERQLSQLVRLVDDLLDVSRISQGKLELRVERQNLSDVVSSAIETSRALIDEMGHELIVSLPSEPVFVQADHIRLSQVLMNLLNNAAKYSERGSRIWLTIKRLENEVVVTVKDSGIGIESDQLTGIFDLFSQLDHSLSKSQGGLGIGLSLVKRLVEMHGGSVEAKSDGIGKGSEFEVRLPILVDPPKSAEPQIDDFIRPKSSLRILVVDDNRDGADSLSMMLKIMGNEIQTAYDGAEAVEMATDFQPDVILLDIGLPKLNGHEACQRIRQLPGGNQITIIAQTGWGGDEDRQQTQAAGFDHHMVKPIDPKTLMTMLSRVAESVNH